MEIKFVGNWNAPQYGEMSTISIDLEWDTVTIFQDTPRRPGDGTPMRQWHGIEREYTADGETDGDGQTHVDPEALCEYIEGDGQELLARILDGGSVEWDGNNHVGRMSDDAQTAETEFTAALLDLPRLHAVDWTCDEWFGQCMSDIYALDSVDAARAFGDDSTDPAVILDEDPGEWCAQEWKRYHADDEGTEA